MQVTLLVPWLAKCEQKIVYPDGITFETTEEQGKWIKDWVKERTTFPCSFTIKFYPGALLPHKACTLPTRAWSSCKSYTGNSVRMALVTFIGLPKVAKLRSPDACRKI